MLRLTELKLPLDHGPDAIAAAVLERLRVSAHDLVRYAVARRGHDARRKSAIVLIYSVDVTLRDETAVLSRFVGDARVRPSPDTEYRFVARAPAGLAPRPVVIGTGPCGLFAALILAQMGFKPLILDRGKKVRERTQDTWGLWRRSVLDPESNVQFGEGGAGTFSDGKLYSQIKDPRHLGRKVLTEFVQAGAPPDILTEAHPHIGTFRLVKMVESLRATIEALGGEYRFRSRVDNLDIETTGDGARRIRGVVLASGEHIAADHVVLAVGHSARDTFEMLRARGVFLEAKPFSIGFRIEHPQSLIDRARFGAFAGHAALGAADYKLVHHCAGRPLGLQLLHVPRRHRRCGHVRGRPRRDQRHEPVLAQRAQRECGHRGRHHARGLPGPFARRHRPPAPLGGACVHGGRRDLRRARPTRGRFFGRTAFEGIGLGRAVVPAPCPSDRSVRLPAGLRRRRDPRGIAGFRPANSGLRDGRRGPDGRRNPHVVAHPDRPRRGIRKPEHAGALSGGRGCGIMRAASLSAGVDGIKVAEAVAHSMLAAEANVRS